ncbi:MAG TPA: TldD/PmbA family protein [Gemmatimonadaceae bacterium]|jgi:predicted Zn-dependent protease|nr:TldD/PmbA family protein [Gemmatimonadaceae bacterium]
MSYRPLSLDDARTLAERVLSLGKGDETRVTISSTWTGNTRFAANEVTTAGGATNTTVSVTSTIGKRRASAQTNVLDDRSLARTVELAERLARLAPEDPELMPELAAQQYTAVRGFAERTANLSPEARALAAQTVLSSPEVPANQLAVAGYIEANAGVAAVATSRGLFAYHPSSTVTMSTTARTSDGTGSGYAGRGSTDWAQIEPRSLGARAVRKALDSRNPQAVEPGQYTVVLEPQAVADVLPLLIGAMNARSADEGRSPFAKRGGGTKIGERVADERVTIYSDPADPELLTRPFDDEGLPIGRTVWIENGVLRSLAYTRYWAQQQNAKPMGGAASVGGFGGGGGAGFGGIKMLGGDASIEELVAGTDRGILVTRFWYIRSLDPRTVLNTGLTRDGTFLIEKGKVTRSIKNFRWNESPLFMLNKLDALGKAEQVRAGLVVPAMRVRDFTFTSLSDAV